MWAWGGGAKVQWALKKVFHLRAKLRNKNMDGLIRTTTTKKNIRGRKVVAFKETTGPHIEGTFKLKTNILHVENQHITLFYKCCCNLDPF